MSYVIYPEGIQKWTSFWPVQGRVIWVLETFNTATVVIDLCILDMGSDSSITTYLIGRTL